MKNKFFLMRIFLVSLFFLSPFFDMCVLVAQSAVSKAVYLCETHLETSFPVFDGQNTLYFNNYESLYIHDEVPAESYSPYGDAMKGWRFGDPEGFPVYINRKEKYLYYKAYAARMGNYFILKEELPQIAWEITDQTKQLDGLFCIKAYGEFGGRVYDVWFTPDIPVPLGPYKLGGLPGLILQAKSRDGRVAYEFVSYESSVEEHPPIAPPKIGRYVTWEELEEIQIALLLKIESHNTATSGGTLVDPPENYTIEKGKFKIYSEYKARRRRKE